MQSRVEEGPHFKGMANSKAGQAFVRIGRRTGRNVFPAKKIIGRENDGTEMFKDYWTDSDHSDDDSESTIPPVKTVPSKIKITPPMRIETQNWLGRRTGVRVLSGKRIRLRKDGTEDFNDYWTDHELETDPSTTTCSSSLFDTSRRMHPSGSTDTSNLTGKSNARKSDAHFRDWRDSYEPEKTVHNRSCNTSGSFKNRLILTSHLSANAVFEPQDPSPSLFSAENSQKKISKTFRTPIEPVSVVVSETMTNRKMNAGPSIEVSKQGKSTMRVIVKKTNRMIIEDISDDVIENEIDPESELRTKIISPKIRSRLQRQNRIVESSSSDREFDSGKKNEIVSSSKKMPFRSSTSNYLNQKNNTNKNSKKEKILSTSGSSRNNNHVIEFASDNMVEKETTSTKPRNATIGDNSYQISKTADTRLSKFLPRQLVDYSNGNESEISQEKEIVSSATRKESVADISRKSSETRYREITKNSSLHKSSKKNKFTEDLENNSNMDIDSISLMSDDGSISKSKTQKQHNKRKKISRESKSRAEKSRNTSKRRDTSWQRTSRKKIRVLESDSDEDDIATDGVPITTNETDVAYASTSQCLPPKTPSTRKKLYSANSSKMLRNMVEYAESNPEDLERELEAKSKIDAPRSKKISSSRQKNSLLEDIENNPESLELELEAEPYINAPRGDTSKRKKSKRQLNLGKNSETSEQEFEAEQKINATSDRKSKKISSKIKRNSVENIEAENLEQELEIIYSEPEITAPKGKKAKIPTDQLRRSNRERIAPLKHWANERRFFAHDIRTGEIKNLGIIAGTGVDDACQKYLERREAKNLFKKKKPRKEKTTSVFNRRTDKEERVILRKLFEWVNWESPFGKKDDANPGYFLCKPFSSDDLTFGFLKIFPLESKPVQVSPKGNIYFLVAQGRVKVTIRNSEFEFQKMDTFIVPKHQPYAIENLLDSNAFVSFCAFKVPFFDYEKEDFEKNEKDSDS